MGELEILTSVSTNTSVAGDVLAVRLDLCLYYS